MMHNSYKTKQKEKNIGVIKMIMCNNVRYLQSTLYSFAYVTVHGNGQ